MENIIRRALIVFTVLAALFGSFSLIYFYVNSPAPHRIIQDYDARHDACEKAAEMSGDHLPCWNLVNEQPYKDAWARQTELGKDGNNGTLSLLLAIILWPIFFVTRWIFTGRWKGKAIPSPRAQ